MYKALTLSQAEFSSFLTSCPPARVALVMPNDGAYSLSLHRAVLGGSSAYASLLLTANIQFCLPICPFIISIFCKFWCGLPHSGALQAQGSSLVGAEAGVVGSFGQGAVAHVDVLLAQFTERDLGQVSLDADLACQHVRPQLLHHRLVL